MAYSTISKPSLHFNTKLYTGNASTNAITGVGHQPDLVWLKERSSAGAGLLFDAVRTATKFVRSSDDAAEVTAADTLTAFNSDGFTLGADAANYAANQNSETYASWNWKANGSSSANTDGTINTTVSANTTAGFSIITYTGTGSAGTIGHGLGVKPSAWHVKARSETRAWYGWHHSIPLGDVINLNGNGAKSTDTSLFTSTAPTTSVINLGSSVGTNNNGITFVCYAFAEKTGYSKFGSYAGNGNSSGPFIYTGFKPAWLMVKSHIGTDNWIIYDSKRNGINSQNARLYANTSSAEDLTAGQIDLLSNGFRPTSDYSSINYNGGNYIYYAFAEEPLVANVGQSIPATAR